MYETEVQIRQPAGYEVRIWQFPEQGGKPELLAVIPCNSKREANKRKRALDEAWGDKMLVTADLMWRIRERGLIPDFKEDYYDTPRLKQIAEEMRALQNRMDALDRELQQLAAKEAMDGTSLADD